MDKNKQTSIENFDQNVLAAFTYLLPPISGIIFFLIEKKSKLVKFHAMQSILFGVLTYVALNIIANLRIILIGFILQPIVTIGSFCLWLLLMWKAYQNEMYELPFIGKIAKEQVEKAMPENNEPKKEDTVK